MGFDVSKNRHFHRLSAIICLLIAAVLTACGGGGSDSSASIPPGKALTSFSINGIAATINETYKTVAITLPYGSSVTALQASFTTNGVSVAVGNTAQISSASVNDFSQPVTYVVNASDGSFASYTVTVTVALASSKALTAFSVMGLTGAINESQKTIYVTLPHNTNPTLLLTMAANFTSTGVSVSVGGLEQISGITANDFSNLVIYTVTAADGSSASYSVLIRIALVTDKAITDFVLNGVSGVVDEVHKTIGVVMPFADPLTSLVATFATTGNGVSIGNVQQASGMAGTPNNFANSSVTPVVYTVQAADGTTASYSVYVRNAPATAKAITEFVLAGVYGVIDEVAKTISVTMPNGSNLTNLAAAFSTTAAGVPAVSVAGTAQISGSTVNNFTNPVSYVVTPNTGTSVTYTVTVTTALTTDKALTFFALDGVKGTISGNTINVVMPFSYPINNLVATYLTTGTGVSISTTPQTSGITSNDYTRPLVYTVTAADGSMANYTVTVSNAANTDSIMTEFSLNGVPGVITQPMGTQNGNILVTIARGTNLDLTSVVANYSTSGKRVHIANTTQISGFTPNNFTTNPLTYTVDSVAGGNNWSLYHVFLYESTCDTSVQSPYLVIGDYRLYNNPWGQGTILPSQFTECMSGAAVGNPQTGVSANWTWNWPFTANSNGSFNGLTLRAYPGIQYRPAGVAPNILLSAITPATTLNHNITVTDTTATVSNLALNPPAPNPAGSLGDFNVAYDIWLDSLATQNTNCYKSEIMIKLAGTWTDVPLISTPSNTLTTATTDGASYLGATPPAVGATTINLLSATPLTLMAGDVITIGTDIVHYTIASQVTVGTGATPVTLTSGLQTTIPATTPIVGPAITLVSTPQVVTTIAGIPFYLSVGTMTSPNSVCTWNYYSFIGYTTRPVGSTTLAANLPLKSFTDYLINTLPGVTLPAGSVPPTSPVLATDIITGIEFGTEIAQGSGTATVNSFTVTP